MVSSYAIILAVKIFIYYTADPSQALVYTLHFLVSCAIGVCMNLQFVIVAKRFSQAPHLLAIALELCFAFASMIASLMPIVAVQKEPLPVITNIIFCILGIIFVSRFPSPKLSPPSSPWFCVSKCTLFRFSSGHCVALCVARSDGE